MSSDNNLYSRETIRDVQEKASILDHVPGVLTSGRRNYVRCPKCGASGKVKGKLKGVILTDKGKMHIGKCFDCGFSFGSAIDAEMHYTGKGFREALEACATRAGMSIETEADREKRVSKEAQKRDSGSFYMQQLTASGLTPEDVMVKTVNKRGEEEWVCAFRKGSMDTIGNVNPDDDDMVIYYYDIHGKPLLYKAATRGYSTKQYVRVRWSNPGLHRDHSGKDIKYQTPKGASAQFYIPQKIREAFSTRSAIDTLIIQEGEKKAEKACKHGILSLGIQGIYNIGNAEQGLMQGLTYIVRACKVKNIVLLFDSDWDHLNNHLTPGMKIDMRPMQFAKAAIKFRTYTETLHNEGINFDVWFGHINSEKEKGIDDLLTGSLHGHEGDFLEDMAKTMKTHDGKGTYADFHKISTLTDFQIFDFWNLGNFEKFEARHHDRLISLDTFRFSNVTYVKNSEGKFEPKSNSGETLEFWEIKRTRDGEKEKKEIIFSRLALLDFLSANNYRTVHTADMRPGESVPAIIEDSKIEETSLPEIKRFIFSFLRQSCKIPEVSEKFLSNIGKIVSADLVDQLPRIDYNDFFADPNRQLFPFKNGFVEVTAQGINSGAIGYTVWRRQVINRTFKREPIFKKMEWSDDRFIIEETDAGLECEFLTFLKLTSNFWHRPGETINLKEALRHVVNKMSCIGYLLHSYKDRTLTKAVIAMDARMSEVGKSNGRSGKSFIATALEQLIGQTLISGRKLNASDEFVYNSVSLDTRTIVFDDVKQNFDFGHLSSDLTAAITVNVKGGRRFDIPFDRSPKIYITTNHAISNDDDSTKARRILMSFSDYFNIDNTPRQVFGHAFFQEWDERQWNLFDNFMLECVELHLKAREQEWEGSPFGLIDPPMQDLRMRQLRQLIGESFLLYAEDEFNESDTSKLGRRYLREDAYKQCLASSPDLKKFLTPRAFREKLEAFAKFKGYHLNPQKKHKESGLSFTEWIQLHPGESFIGASDKSNGKEYITISRDGTVNINPFS